MPGKALGQVYISFFIFFNLLSPCLLVQPQEQGFLALPPHPTELILQWKGICKEGLTKGQLFLDVHA